MDKNSKKHKSKNKNLEDVLDGFGQIDIGDLKARAEALKKANGLAHPML